MSFTDALKEVDGFYKDLSKIAKDIVTKHCKDIDVIFKNIRDNVDTMTNQEISAVMLKLSAESYFFGGLKDLVCLKEECAEAIYKEGIAHEYILSSGSVASRQNDALLNSRDKQAVSILYGSVSLMMKTKLDEIHRMVNTLNSVLITRNAELKVKNNA